VRSKRIGPGALFALVALLCGLGAAWLGTRLVESARRTAPVLVARALIPPMQRIAGGDVAVARLPVAAVPADALANPAEAVGSYARVGFAPGAVVQRSALARGDGSSLDAQLTAAEAARGGGGAALRAVPLPLDAAHGYGLVAAGDRVDVVVAADKVGGGLVQTAARGVLVEAKLPAAGRGDLLAGQDATAAGSGVLVLALSPEEAERVLLGEILGQVTVLLDPLSGIEAQSAPALTAAEWAAVPTGLRQGGR
jgi:Flp pilus assembly protein CpaB